MSITLRKVEPQRGYRWMRDGFSQFHRRPLMFSAMFLLFLLVSGLVSVVPVIGFAMQFVLWPLLSLGFMIATQSVLLGGSVHPRQFIEPLRGDPQRRTALIRLCLIFGAAVVLILLLCDAVSDGALRKLMQLSTDPDRKPEELAMLMADPGLAAATLLGTALLGLLSVPFWHAPALVHWSGQGAAQALFSSTLAVWRAKGAFFVYGLSWTALLMVFYVFVALLLGALGLASLAAALLFPALLIYSTVFYVSLLFVFNDSFGGSGGAVESAGDGGEGPATPAAP